MAIHVAYNSLECVASLLEESEHPLLLTDRSGRILYANQLACERLGIGGPWSAVASQVEHEMFGAKFDGVLFALENGESRVGLEVQHCGQRIQAQARLLPKSDWLLIRLWGSDVKIEADAEPEQLQDGVVESDNEISAMSLTPGSGGICEPLGDGLYFLASTPQMKRIREQTLRVASVNVPVLITGESGAGKEVIARLIYEHANGRKGPFVKVNCAALPAELLESELFGYEQGAFTGAVRAKPGKFELADHGTIFLDEIAEMSTHLQSKLLHVLQDGRFSRLGSRHMIHVDVRVIAATNMDVQEAIQEGRLREDLYYRLNVVPCHLPPLRERIEEIPMLFRLFFARYSREFGRTINPPGLFMLEAAQQYFWPGNVRELENFVKRYVILADEEESLQELLKMGASRNGDVHSRDNVSEPQNLKRLVRGLKEDAERQAIADALKQTHWRRKDTARILGISYKALLYKMRQFGFTPASSNGHGSREREIVI